MSPTTTVTVGTVTIGAITVTLFVDSDVLFSTWAARVGDVDFFSFFGKGGQTLIVEVDAAFFGSSLPAQINLTDPTTGTQYFVAAFDGNNDPMFNIVWPGAINVVSSQDVSVPSVAPHAAGNFNATGTGAGIGAFRYPVIP